MPLLEQQGSALGKACGARFVQRVGEFLARNSVQPQREAQALGVARADGVAQGVRPVLFQIRAVGLRRPLRRRAVSSSCSTASMPGNSAS